jgi:8-oxo-dGTP pyrophosphatase MutT (NUDIX family)
MCRLPIGRTRPGCRSDNRQGKLNRQEAFSMKEISAGGIVYRKRGNTVEIQMIRDRFGKVAFPKGKMEPGETIEQTALREIGEETGIVGVIRQPLETVRYRYVSSEAGVVDKEVHYFLVEATGGSLRAQTEEINGVEWFEPKEVWRLQRGDGYDNMDSVVRKALLLLGCEVERP